LVFGVGPKVLEAISALRVLKEVDAKGAVAR
jgi:hypothetical protein